MPTDVVTVIEEENESEVELEISFQDPFSPDSDLSKKTAQLLSKSLVSSTLGLETIAFTLIIPLILRFLEVMILLCP
jgi:hypothetical protein